MSKPTAWIRHPQTKAVVEVPASAIPIYVQSGWVQLSDPEIADLYAKQAEQRRAAESAMAAASKPKPTPSPRVVHEPAPIDDREQPLSAPARPKSGSSSKENS